MKILIDNEIRKAAPELEVVIVRACVCNRPTPDPLWNEIEAASKKICDTYKIEDIRHRPAIAGTRDAYKALGKEPNRYRPSAEALCRRIVRGLGLYRSDSVVDLINLISIESGVSIGGFDEDRIDGDVLTLGAGRENEPYEAIGRGQLNIAGMPVFRDSSGGIGTPTSDNDRTKLSPGTRRLLMTINIYRPGELTAEQITALTTRLLQTYADATDIETFSVR